ncbi:MAG: hypothetical protein H7Y42_13465 [Chitinophagaceae bacterium]|nr:hypothetical protein [Chitinophagaceae bacterium]
MEFTWFPQNDDLQAQIKSRDEMTELIRFANDYYTLEKRSDTVVLNVLRFGQITGWHDPHQQFCFYYYLDSPGANDIVAQRGRFANWNKPTIRSFLRRIRGN